MKLRLSLLLVMVPVLTVPACQQKMARQPSFRQDEPSEFFSDGRADRPSVLGTIARGYLRTDDHLYAGKMPARLAMLVRAAGLTGAGGTSLATSLATTIDAASDLAATTFPFRITTEVLKRGQERYTIYCLPCHDALGTGHGHIVERGYTPPPSFHSAHLRAVPVGHIFNVASRGLGSMPSYAKQIPPHDRWAIVAYVRALQLSQHMPVEELPPDLHARLFAKAREDAP